MPIASPKSPAEANPGAILKALRKKSGWGLAEVSEKTGLPISTLSRLENGKMAMTYEKLKRISAGLSVDMGVLIGSSAVSQRIEGGFRRCIVRAGEGQVVATTRGDYLYVAADMLSKLVTPIIGLITARSIDEYDEFLRHAGEEYVYVLSGTLILHTEAYGPATLETGDSMYFDSAMGHAYVAAGDMPCQVLSICAAGHGEASGSHPMGPQQIDRSLTMSPSAANEELAPPLRADAMTVRSKTRSSARTPHRKT